MGIKNKSPDSDAGFVTLEEFKGVSDAQAWALANTRCAATGKSILLTKMYSIDTNINLTAGVSVAGKNRVNTGLTFSGTAALTHAGTDGTKNGGNITLSNFLISHTSFGVALKLRNCLDVLCEDVEFYHASVTAYNFSYLTFRDCIGFDMGFVASNAANNLNESPKFLGGRYSNVTLTTTETTDVVLDDAHWLGPSSQILCSRGSHNAGLYPLVTINNVVVDSTNNECISLNGMSPRISNTFVSGGRTNLKPGIYLVDCKEGAISATTARYCGSNGLQMESCYGIDVSGATLTDNKLYGAQIATCSKITFRGNLLGNTAGWFGGSYVQTYGIVDSPENCIDTIVTDNKFVGNSTSPVYMPNNSTVFGINIGLVRSSYGTASVTTVTGSATIAHGLGAVPKTASAIAISGADIDTQITALDSTNITIRTRTSTTNANISAAATILWRAQL